MCNDNLFVVATNGNKLCLPFAFLMQFFFFCFVFLGNDSFVAFEEILYHAKHHQVDFVLLGGDLFHDTNPSKEALHRYDIANESVIAS